MKAFYQDGWITLYCGDCFDILPYLAQTPVSFVYADPPYGLSIVKSSGVLAGRQGVNSLVKRGRKPPTGTVGGGKPFGDGTKAVIEPGRYHPVIGDDTTETAVKSSELCLSLWPNAVQVWWGANHYASSLPSSPCWIVWDKENTGLFADAELAWTNQKTAVRIVKHMWNGLMKDSERGERRIHPTQKPVVVASWILQKYGSVDDIILDPFAGSGSTLVAAKKLNRKCIGIEASEHYCELIRQRLAQECLDLR